MLKTAILTTGLALAAASAEPILFCGAAPYYPDQYTCYTDFLCPIIRGVPTLQCGNACYLPTSYSCSASGALVQQNTPARTPYTVSVTNSLLAALNGVAVSACAHAFVVSNETCTSCPVIAGAPPPCAAATNTTVFHDQLALQTIVPGGQTTYMTALGALGYTIAHSAAIPANATRLFDTDVVAYTDGLVRAPRGATGWLACPGGDGAGYRISAALEGVIFAAACVGVDLSVSGVPEGTVGAWQYD